MSNFTNTRTVPIKGQDELFYKKYFIDKRANDENNYAAAFIRDDLTYGNGIKQIFVGTIENKDYDKSSSPFENLRINPEIEVATLKDGVEVKRIITIDDFDYENFNSAEEKQQFDDAQVASLTEQETLRDNKAIIKAFGGEVPANVFSPKETTLWDNIKNVITNIRTEELGSGKNHVDFTQKIIETSYKLSQEDEDNAANKNKTHITYTKKADQILVISYTDHLEIMKIPYTEINQAFINDYMNMKKLILPIPAKTAFIIDKNALNIYPRFKAYRSQSYIDPLITKSVLHSWYKAGFIDLYAGRKITME